MAAPSQLATSVIETAFLRLKATVAASDAHNFDSATLKDVRQAALDIEKAQRQRASVRNMRKLEPFLKALEIYAKPLDVLCNGTPFLPWIWIASQYNESFEKLLDAYAQIAEVLPRFDRYASTFSEPELHASLACVYADIAEFHRRAYKFFRQRAWKLLFDSGWKSFELRFSGILARLKEHRDNIDKEASSFDIQAASWARKKWEDEIAMAEEERGRIHRHAVLAWLAMNETHQDNVLLKLTEKRYDNTCNWLLGHTKYTQWSVAARSQSLWLHGIPGSGKSVLCARVIDDLRDAKKHVLHYFCNPGGSSGDPCEHMLRTLCAQIVRISHDLAELIWIQFVTKAASPSIGTLRILLPQLLSALSSTSLVIDGIDEFPMPDVRTTLQTLLRIAKTDDHKLRIFLSSRNEPIIAQHMRGAVEVSLREENSAVQSDIKVFLQKRLRDAFTDWCVSISDSTRSLVEEELLKRSRGMFLWVELVIRNLEFCFTDEDMLEGVKLLPRTLREAYDRMLSRIFGVDSDIMKFKIKRVLQMLAYMRRSLSLREILCALSTAPEDINASLPLPHNPRLLDFCKPLVEVSVSGTVELIHFSAVEYLRNPESQYHLLEEDSELVIGNICLTYLRHTDSFLDSSKASERWAQIVRGSHDIHRYAMMHWSNHTMACLQRPYQAEHQSKALLRARLNTSWWLLKDLDPKHANKTVPSADDEAANPWNLLPEFLRLMLIIEKSSEQSGLSVAESRQEPGQNTVESDLTWLSTIQNQYENDMAFLLDENRSAPSLGVDVQALQDFRLAHAPGALYCRVWNCPRGETPFRTIHERDLHEMAHMPRYQCNELHCSRRGQGFRSEKLLKMHHDKYHTDLAHLLVPKIPAQPPATTAFESKIPSEYPSKGMAQQAVMRQRMLAQMQAAQRREAGTDTVRQVTDEQKAMILRQQKMVQHQQQQLLREKLQRERNQPQGVAADYSDYSHQSRPAKKKLSLSDYVKSRRNDSSSTSVVENPHTGRELSVSNESSVGARAEENP